MSIGQQHSDGAWTRGAGELAQLIRSGELTARHVIQEHLDRIAEVNPTLNAITSVHADDALACADRVDAAIRAGVPVGPLAGVPFTV